MSTVKTIEWVDGAVRLIDQAALPLEGNIIECRTAEQVADAIRGMKVRGAPVLGVAAAYAAALWAEESIAEEPDEFFEGFWEVAEMLKATRPTAVNIAWALDRLGSLITSNRDATVAELKDLVVAEAQQIAVEDIERNKAIGEHGQELIGDGARILTHCNAGSLATVGYGTALSPIFHAHREGKEPHVFASETRPLLQGARLTAWELIRSGVPVTLITDSMVGWVLAQGAVDMVLVGGDRVAANGDVANKIGTYTVAVLAARHEVPFYVCAPTSSIDLATPEGASIPIEERDPDEVLMIAGKRIAPEGVSVYNPAFDVTPAELIAGIVTEHGIARAPYAESLAAMCAGGAPAEAPPDTAEHPAATSEAATD